MPLKSRSIFPPGGWAYHQPQTGWNMPNPVSVTFSQAVDLIVAHRAANSRHNLSTDWMSVSVELDEYTCARLGNNPTYCADLKKKLQTHPQSEPVLEVGPQTQGALSKFGVGVAGVIKLVGGARILKSWLGAGSMPVEPAHAQSRASVCLQCPHNTPGGFVASKITKPIADSIREQMRVKSQLAMTVKGEENLHTCNVCLCPLPLKVHTPISHIADNTSKELLAEFPDFCWTKKEILAA